MTPPSSRLLRSPCPPGGEPGAVLVETDRLMIRRYLFSDAAALAEAANHAAVATNLRDGFPHPYTLAEAQSFLRRHSGTVDTRYPTHGAIFIKPDTADNPSSETLLVGALGIAPDDDVYYRTWELGYWLTPSAWGKGIMTEAVYAFSKWILETWPGLNRLEAATFSNNGASMTVLTKCGFVQEGTRRGVAEKNGCIVDEVIFGLIRSDLEPQT
ncbi:hypothetical protein HIM_11962 [Hirsutella minnesotensis 3608]|uniref:N-acetyltransferase domain-containing protein n=1 Tax=Hirsutella minnesotensis 3608 TaxID=1043627 RepID=A0A0F7ZQX9_9HYPO|nr:hypothetical protein HIM_11962 [Hirsutella minnesotensis 3608]